MIHNVDPNLNLGDITQVDENKLNDFDLMTWGFPCTDLSAAGRQKGFIDENGNKTAVAERYSEEFAEIIVDEYQDISFLQDDILRAISNGHNLFMVGDIKQAIYRFREANPEVFNEKYKKYEVYKGKIESDKEGYKIMLSENYRSRKQVLEASNYIFNGLMSETLGEVEYGEDTKLITGSKFPNADDKIYNTEIVSIYKPSKNTKKVMISQTRMLP